MTTDTPKTSRAQPDRERIFLDKLIEAGGSYRTFWSTKRNPEDRYDNVRYIAAYGAAGEHGHPYACGVILNSLDRGLQVLIETESLTDEGDIAEIFRRAADTPPQNRPPTFNERELATVLASLRIFQDECASIARMPHFEGVEGGPLSDDEIDALCERLNMDEPQPTRPTSDRPV